MQPVSDVHVHSSLLKFLIQEVAIHAETAAPSKQLAFWMNRKHGISKVALLVP